MGSNQFVRLKKRSEFLSVTKKGRRYHVNEWLMLNWLKADEPEVRVGWTIPGYVGTAVTRNRLKRWLKEYLAKEWRPRGEGLVIHFLLKKRTAAFYKALDHGQFKAAVATGLRNVERRQKKQE